MSSYYDSEDHRNYLTGTWKSPAGRLAPDTNPVYPDRKVSVNQRLDEVQAYSASALAARSWLGAASCELRFPKWGEDDLFAEAVKEVERLTGEVRR